MKLEGKAAVITGGGRGLGRAIAIAMAREGARVMVVSRSGKEIHEVAREISNSGGEARAFAGDVSDPDDVSKLIKEVMESFSGLDVLVNNAGVIGPARFLEETDLESWQRTLAINLHGVFHCSRAAALIMAERRRGKMINISSGLGQMPFPRFCAYAVSKAGVIQFTRSLAEELKAFHIQVNAIDPGMMNTRMQEEVRGLGPSVLGNDIFEHFVEYKERGLLREPDLVASLAVFLASSEAEHLTGYFGTLDTYRRLGWRP